MTGMSTIYLLSRHFIAATVSQSSDANEQCPGIYIAQALAIGFTMPRKFKTQELNKLITQAK